MLLLRRLGLPLLLVAGGLSLAAPASAAPSGSTATGDVVLYQHCQRHPISYDFSPDPGTTYWRLEIQVADPKGRLSQGTVVTSADSTGHGTVLYTFCGSERPGTYSVKASGFTEGLPLVQREFALPDAPFQVRAMATRTRLTKARLGGGRYQLTTKVRQQAERGFERADGIPVLLERRASGRWKKVRGLNLTTVHGKAVARVSAAGRYRAVVTERDNHKASVSRPVRVG